MTAIAFVPLLTNEVLDHIRPCRQLKLDVVRFPSGEPASAANSGPLLCAALMG